MGVVLFFTGITVKNIAKIFFINFLILLLLTMLIESLLGRWHSGDLPNVKYSISVKSYIDRSSVGITPEVIVLEPKTNGFRFFSNMDLSNKNECLIIVMGGSTTQEYILSDKETWAYRLQRKLNAQSDNNLGKCAGNFKILNAGISGHSIWTNLWLLKNWITEMKIKPVAIIVYQGINDFHANLNRDYTGLEISTKMHVKELHHDLQMKSFFYYNTTKIFETLKEQKENKPISKLKDGILFKLKKPKKNKGNFVSETISHEFRNSFEDWGGVKFHRRIIRDFVDFSKSTFPNSKIIFITQTKSICDLTDFPNSIKYRESSIDKRKNLTPQKPKEFSFKDWYTPRGECFRLGIVKSNYLSEIKERKTATIIDYAGNYVESLSESYDDYHKNPSGSKIFFDRISESLLKIILQ